MAKVSSSGHHDLLTQSRTNRLFSTGFKGMWDISRAFSCTKLHTFPHFACSLYAKLTPASTPKMASVIQRGGKWRALVSRNGIRRSDTFRTKTQAWAWATQTEREIEDGLLGKVPNKTFGDLLARYRDEITPHKRGERWEALRLNAIITNDPVASVRLPALDAPDFAEWRDRRLKSVSPASVRREWTLLTHACNVAVKEWLWLRRNPMKGVTRPKPSPARDRRITDREIELLLFALAYSRTSPPITQTARVGAAFLFAIETAMRAGEIAKLEWANVDMNKRVARLLETKNSTTRDVALSPEALRILAQLEPVTKETRVFGISGTQTIDAIFRKAKAKAMILGLRFHDTRHEAITRLAKKLDVLSLARMVGHRDLRQLQIYYNESAADMAARLI